VKTLLACLKVNAILAGALLLMGGFLVAGCVDMQAPRPEFAQKDCLDCHKQFADRYFGMKDVHPVVKERKCESCHLRHGLVPKLILKKDGNEVCYQCHTKEKLGLNRKHIHGVLVRGKCTDCHDPHASQTSYLLKAEGDGACFQCHNRADYQKRVVHRASSAKGCLACHFAHSSDEKNLLVKPEVPLCVSCHDPNRPQFTKAHAGYPVAAASSCTGCHNPHASLQAKLLKTSAHDPTATLQCEMCHKPAASSTPFETVDDVNKLCSNCHDLSVLRAGGTVDHAPFRMGCAPHAICRTHPSFES
jgi:predicted CXXCH cytochrome family protein